MQYVTIPFEYEALPYEQRASIVPICIGREDSRGESIDWRWFEAVETVQEPLRRLARVLLGDVWRVSELAETSVLTLWEKHRSNLGGSPAGQVFAQARWLAKDLKAGTWRQRRGIEIAIEGLDAIVQTHVLRDPADYEGRYRSAFYFQKLSRRLKDAGRDDVNRILACIRDGRTWAEIGEQFGEDPDATRIRFSRWLKKLTRDL